MSNESRGKKGCKKEGLKEETRDGMNNRRKEKAERYVMEMNRGGKKGCRK